MHTRYAMFISLFSYSQPKFSATYRYQINSMTVYSYLSFMALVSALVYSSHIDLGIRIC